MKKFLQIEYLKIKGNNSFKVFSLVFIVFLPLIVVFLPSVFKVNLMGVDSYPLMPTSASGSWYFTTYIASWFSLFILSFIIIFHITNEYSAKTVRQNIIDGYSKIDFLKSKIFMVLFMAVTAAIYVFLVGVVASLYFKSHQPEQMSLEMLKQFGITELPVKQSFGGVFDGVLFSLAYFLQVLAYFILAVLVSMFLRKGALAVITYFSLFLLELIFVGQLNNNGLEKITPYFPLRSFSNLLPNFDWSLLISGMQAGANLTALNAVVSILYMIIFVFITKVIFFKRDVV